MSTNSTNKTELRRQLLRQRRMLNTEVVLHRSRTIAETLEHQFDWRGQRVVSVFLPLSTQKEVDPTAFIAWLHMTYQTQLFVAGLDEHGEVAHYPYKPGDATKSGQFGLATPLRPPQSKVPFDSILVPTLGFDDTGNRIGYGQGHYDRLLAAQPNAQSIGLSYEIGHQPAIPAESHDTPLDWVVTEQAVYEFTRTD